MKFLYLKIFFIFLLPLISGFSFGQESVDLIKVVASDRKALNHFGQTVSLSGNYVIIGAPLYDKSTEEGTLFDVGAAYIFEKDADGNWIEVKKLMALDGEKSDWFGHSVDISGNYAIVGAFQNNSSTGAAYIFERDDTGNWSQVIKLTASDKSAIDNFGIAVAIDGKYAIVGANNEDQDVAGGNTISDSGSGYIFERDDTEGWVEIQKIVPSTRVSGGLFGLAVGISGGYAIVSAAGENEVLSGGAVVHWAGEAYIFEKNDAGIWEEAKKITASDGSVRGRFGIAVSIDGNHAIVGAHYEDTDVAGSNTLEDAGSSYIFERDDTGNWEEVQKIVASEREANAQFGLSVSVSGNLAVVGAPYKDDNATGNAGFAYVFQRNSSGIWKPVQKVTSPDVEANDYFGRTVCIEDSLIISGAFGHNNDLMGETALNNPGAAYIFEPDPEADLDPNPDPDPTPLGVPEYSANHGIRLFPNPANHDLNISFDDKVWKNMIVKIYSLDGQTVSSSKFTYSENLRINVSNLNAGMYFVNIASFDKSVTFKIIKNR